MALEQWEIDLRRQLEGKVNNTKPKDTWEQKLVEEIQTLPRNIEKPKDTNNTIVMLVLLIILGVATLFAYDAKSGDKVQSWFASLGTKSSDEPIFQQPSVSGPKNYDAEIASLRSDIQKVDADNKVKLDNLTTKVQWNNDRLSLMGLLLNENFMIVRNNYNKGHLIFFNRDWTLDQMPHYLELTDDDKEYLKKFVKPSGQ
jgi:hypothetical protein